ncbi:integrin beta-PS-like [Cloeon dipterum]|uniref:integrin beta-PS-like n=1 Tax=Cloeon dipterum TaxID=197152 RepID=UPI00321FA163
MRLYILILIAIASETVQQSDDLCSHSSLNTCGKCIATPGCAWCESEGDTSRCGKAAAQQWCSGKLTNPQTVIRALQDNPLSTTAGRIVQIKPQKMSIKARPGQKVQFELHYQQAKDYPLDLYYLMDMSNSMKDDKDKLSALGSKLASEMRRRSSNLRMGFGSFVDKVTMPFVNTLTEIPCPDCARPYEFINHLSLTDRTDNFAPAVHQTQISGNVDTPEGGFDALMQAMVCKNEIGWRNESLRMIIFSTDAESHYSGDGRLGGVVEPNDELCHMQNNRYTHGLIQDYPSVAQISNNARKLKMNVIFAVTENVKITYEMLKEAIYNSQTAILKGDSSNVVELIKEQYDKLTQDVIMDYPKSDDFEIKMFSRCKGGNELSETNTCFVKKKGDTITFNVQLEVKQCPASKTQKIYIAPSSINERLEIDLEVDCECDCEKMGNFLASHERCNRQGDLKCGVCSCHQNFWGPNCGCNTNSVSNKEEDNSACERNGETCSHRGECKCGACLCYDPDRYSGQFCQCDNKKCAVGPNGKVCSGPTQGRCDCEGCVCFDGWKSKPDCSCSDNTSSCVPPTGGLACSGHGECVCGECVCRIEQGKGKFFGKFCEDCSTCQDKCDDLKPCVQYQLPNEEGEQLGIPSGCEAYTMLKVEDLNDTTLAEKLQQHQKTEKGERRLRRETNDENPLGGLEPLPEAEALSNSRKCNYYVQGCTYYYKYWTGQDKSTYVFLDTNKECVAPVDIWGVVFGLIGAILLAGIVMLVIWKVATTIHDRREFAKFEKERQAAMFDAGHNPLYKEPASTFQNPTFSQK